MRPAIAEIARRFPQPGEIVGAEIGVWKGDHAAEILGCLQPKRLYLVDPWRPTDRYSTFNRERWGIVKWMLWNRVDWDGICRRVQRRFDGCSNVTILRMTSGEAAGKITAKLHFVYIDGNHDYQAVAEDLASWWPRIRVGGLLCGHDYWSRQPGVIKAVEEFAAARSMEWHTAKKDWWINK
ncbi:class I SAM-dependent methyltransferase [bacterium]|nr:class I SAM-dependent methyltransferase [bacterium]